MRSHYSSQVNSSLVSKSITLCGWVHNRRDHGGVIFTDLRDIDGIVQIVYQPEFKQIFAEAEKLRHEYVIKVSGVLQFRPEDMRNSNLASGEVELIAEQLEILNVSATPPFLPDDRQNVAEDVRLNHRYIDLRRHSMQKNLIIRHTMCTVMREFLNKNRFLEVETPILTKATPEGARDYLVPSRTHQGEFFALPQSPQLFKQLLMMSGLDRYYQITKCFRDEDLRADRQPEFTQLDIEVSFMQETEIQQMMEQMIRAIFTNTINQELPAKFERLTYEQAIKDYGSDKPDLRIPLKLVDIADIFTTVDLKVFAQAAKDSKSRVVALKVPNGANISRKDIDDLTKYAGRYGAKGLAYIKVKDIEAGRDGLQSPITKFLPDQALTQLSQRLNLQNNDIVFFSADKSKIVNDSMGALRVKIAHDYNHIEQGWRPVWVIDWPMFEADNKNNRLQALHHPFTAPDTKDPAKLIDDPLTCKSRAYDLVINGHEVGGGSIRIHDKNMQATVFNCLGMEQIEIDNKFGFFIEALQYGCPPHGGIAFGIDRLAMLLNNTDSIRDVIAFPKTQSAACLLTKAPTKVSSEQLTELSIKINKVENGWT